MKAGLMGLTKAYADELGQYGITVNGIAPGYFQTAMTAGTGSGNEDDPKYIEFKEYVESKGYKVFPMSAPINIGVKEVLGEAARMLEELPYEPELEYEEFNVDVDDIDPNYREVYVEREGNMFVLSGGQLEKIFNSTNFNDTGSLRYLYKYIEKSGAIAKMKEMGLEEGDTVKIKNFEMEFWDEW